MVVLATGEEIMLLKLAESSDKKPGRDKPAMGK